MWRGLQFDYTLGCYKGSLVTHHHNKKIGDALGGLAALGYKEVVQGPLVCDGDDNSPACIDYRSWSERSLGPTD